MDSFLWLWLVCKFNSTRCWESLLFSFSQLLHIIVQPATSGFSFPCPSIGTKVKKRCHRVCRWPLQRITTLLCTGLPSYKGYTLIEIALLT